MRLLILSVATFVFFVCTCRLASAQASGAPDCPAVTLSCPDPSTDTPLTYRATVSGGSRWVTPTYTWSASAGKITGGQGTAELTVDPEGRDSLTVTVEVGGYPAACRVAESCSWIVCRVPSRKLDEYGDIGLADERVRLDAFAEEMRNDPTAQAYILSYAGRRARVGEAQKRGERARSYLRDVHGVEEDRVVVVDGGHREERAVELFIVPSGATPPPATPTVDPKEVEIIGGKAGKRNRSGQP